MVKGTHEAPSASEADGLAVTATIMVVAGAGRSVVFSITAICATSCCS
jgi:hypothetical protein